MMMWSWPAAGVIYVVTSHSDYEYWALFFPTLFVEEVELVP